MVISHNLMAMNAQRQFNIITDKKKKSTEKLASGYKINRAADDAAGLAISEKMRRQIRGLDQGARNTQDGISLLQVADGALNEVHDMLHRITELAVQAANDTNTSEDRAAIKHEIDQIKSEVDRIGKTTEFNTMPLFNYGHGGDTDTDSSETSDGYKYITETITVKYQEKVEDKSYVTETIPAKYAVDSMVCSGNRTNNTINSYSLTADDVGIAINSGYSIPWSDIKSSAGESVDSLSAGTYLFTYNGSKISLQTKDSESIEELVNSIDGVEISISSNTQSIKPVISATAKPLEIENPYYWNISDTIGHDGYMTLSISYDSRTNDITFSDGGRVSVPRRWSSATKFETISDSKVRATITGFSSYEEPNQLSISFEMNKTDDCEDLLKQVIAKKVTISYKGGFNCYLHDAASVSNNGNTYTNSLTNIESALLDAKYNENWVKTSEIKANLCNDGYAWWVEFNDSVNELGKYGPISSIKLYLDYEGLNELNRDSNGGDFVTYHFYKDNSDGTTTDYYINTVYEEDMTSAQKKAALTTNDSLYLSSVYTPNSIKYSNSATSITGTAYDISGLNEAEDKTITKEIISYHYEDRERTETITRKVPIEDESEEDDEDKKSLHLWIQSGAEVGDGMFIEIGQMNSRILGINNLDVSSHENAGKAIDAASKATDIISEMRSKIGAQQNRLEHTYNNVTNIAENTQAAESRMRDTDMAKEMVNNSRHSILEQVGQSMIVQANQSNQGVLNLLL